MMAWAEALDAYEASLGHHRGLVDGAVANGDNPWPPRELPAGPLPEELRDRANGLLTQSNLLIDDMAAKMADIPPRKPSRYSHHSTRDHPRWTKSL